MEVSSNDEQRGKQARPPFYFELHGEARRARESGWAEADLCSAINRGRTLVLLTRYTFGDREDLEHPSKLSPEEQQFSFPDALADILQAAAHAGVNVYDMVVESLVRRQLQWEEAVAEVEIDSDRVAGDELLPTAALMALKARIQDEPSFGDPGDCDG
jgi:hypothetical protein